MGKSRIPQRFEDVKIRAKELRQNLTHAEMVLWARLRNRQLGGVKFRRQHPIGPFIADFYCAEHKLVVEIDGEIHELQIEQDQTRTKQFEDYGYKLLRFHNQQVEKDLESVLRTILESCNRDPQA